MVRVWQAGRQAGVVQDERKIKSTFNYIFFKYSQNRNFPNF